jgi:starch synthase
MRILLATSELHPYSKTGGLADMVSALGKFLGKAGHQVGVVTPLYRGVRDRFPAITYLDYWLDVPLGHKRAGASVWTVEPSPNVTIYFIDNGAYFGRAGIYGENNVEYWDNAERFTFFAKSVTHLARFLTWKPEVVHVHDWQASLVPLLMLHQKIVDGWMRVPRTCLTIHNLGYQGIFPRPAFDLTNLPADYFHSGGVEFYGMMNFLKAGLVYADLLTTVSPRYAREITTEPFGASLDGVLRLRQDSLVGILNGVDYEEWNTAQNSHIKHPYSAQNLKGKLLNKLELQKEIGLPENRNVPVFATIGRLADQKGVRILLGALAEMLASDMQFVLLGSGDPHYERAVQDLAKRFPSKLAVRIGFDHGLSHRIEAGADFFVMPSLYEPCGLNQMYSLRYGTVPIVRVTGGLDDSVVDISEDDTRANGIKFAEFSVRALAKAIRKALVLYGEPKLLEYYRQNGINADFSWERTAQDYVGAYQRTMGG